MRVYDAYLFTNTFIIPYLSKLLLRKKVSTKPLKLTTYEP